jgi:site-specific DNA-cytosine methylase
MTFVKVIRSGARDENGELPPEVWDHRTTAPTLNQFDNNSETRATILAVHQNQRGEINTSEIAYSLNAGGGKPGQGHQVVYGMSQHAGYTEGVTTLTATDYKRPEQNIAVTAPTVFGWQENQLAGNYRDDGTTEPLTTTKTQAIHTDAVRRLTPIECERLMGWPDNWTHTRHDGKQQADSHRYRQIGNGVVSNITQWIGQHLPN